MGSSVMKRSDARDIARFLFPCNLYGKNYRKYEDMDRVTRNDLLDHIEYNEPLNPGSLKEYEN